MKERPLILSAPMVRAVLNRTKSQTRRIIKGLPLGVESVSHVPGQDKPGEWTVVSSSFPRYAMTCPFGEVGDRLWVREAWRLEQELNPYSGTKAMNLWHQDENRDFPIPVQYEADGARIGYWAELGELGRYRHARYMPRWASRLLLEITDVRVQRLANISESDAIAEGIERARHVMWRDYLINNPAEGAFHTPTASFKSLWESIHGPHSWLENPWVFALSFKVVTP